MKSEVISWFVAFSVTLLAGIEAGQPNLLQLAESLNLTSFVEGCRKTGLDKVINHEGPFTIFVPNDEAFAHEKVYPNEVSLKDKLMFHIVWGKIKSNEIQNEMTQKTMLSKRPVRLNVYQNGQVVTANGRQVVATDFEAHNGIIHIISDVMSSVYAKEGSVVSELEECCPHHSVLLGLIKFAGLYGVLDRRGPFTFLAPENGAFAKLHPEFINHLKKNETALRRVLLTHVIPGTTYSPGIKDADVYKTLSNAKICVAKKGGEVKFNTATVQLADVTAKNGAVHTIDEVIFPDKPNDDFDIVFRGYHLTGGDPNFVETLVREGYTHFADALLQTRMERIVDHGHFTIFVPRNEDFERIASKSVSLEERVRSYIVRGLIKESKLRNEMLLPTLLNNHYLRVNIYQTNKANLIMVNGCQVNFSGFQSRNGLVHELEPVGGSNLDLIASDKTLYQELIKRPEFSRFVELMEGSGFYKILDQTQHPFTVFVPTNAAIDKHLASIDKTDLATIILLRHFVSNSWYSQGIARNYFTVSSIGGVQLHPTYLDGELRINGVEISRKDVSVQNGVFHTVEDLF